MPTPPTQTPHNPTHKKDHPTHIPPHPTTATKNLPHSLFFLKKRKHPYLGSTPGTKMAFSTAAIRSSSAASRPPMVSSSLMWIGGRGNWIGLIRACVWAPVDRSIRRDQTKHGTSLLHTSLHDPKKRTSATALRPRARRPRSSQASAPAKTGSRSAAPGRSPCRSPAARSPRRAPGSPSRAPTPRARRRGGTRPGRFAAAGRWGRGRRPRWWSVRRRPRPARRRRRRGGRGVPSSGSVGLWRVP